jgi:hypothetical protein
MRANAEQPAALAVTRGDVWLAAFAALYVLAKIRPEEGSRRCPDEPILLTDEIKPRQRSSAPAWRRCRHHPRPGRMRQPPLH